MPPDRILTFTSPEARERLERSYLPELPEEQLTPEVVDLFTNYSKISREGLKGHIEDIRDKAWKLFPYLCIGRFTFVEFSVGWAPEFSEVLQRVKKGDKYLDVGCFLGQDIRKLVHDGAPSENIVGTDVEAAFFPLGYSLFNDKATLQTTFIASSIIDESDTSLNHLEGTIDIIHASSVFHLFGYNNQVAMGIKCVSLLKRQPGSMIFGRQGASLVSGEKDIGVTSGPLFRHNEESWKKMWQEVIGPRTGTKWSVAVDMDAESPEWMAERRANGQRRMRFTCTLE